VCLGGHACGGSFCFFCGGAEGLPAVVYKCKLIQNDTRGSASGSSLSISPGPSRRWSIANPISVPTTQTNRIKRHWCRMKYTNRRKRRVGKNRTRSRSSTSNMPPASRTTTTTAPSRSSETWAVSGGGICAEDRQFAPVSKTDCPCPPRLRARRAQAIRLYINTGEEGCVRVQLLGTVIQAWRRPAQTRPPPPPTEGT